MRRLPGIAWLVALISCVNALAWSAIVPPFHVPDEPAHLYYAQYLAESGNLPALTPDQRWYSRDVNGVLAAADFYEVVGIAGNRPPADAATQRALRAAQEADRERTGTGDAASATTNPPLYYLAQAAVYRLAPSDDLLDRLVLMRVLSALLAGLTILCVFAFLRELLPGTPWAWTVGSLVVGLQPLFAFMSSGVNNDALLYLAAAALMLAVARALRRGLTPRRAAAIGLILGAGVLVKTQLIAFAPGVALAFVLLLRRARRRPLALAAAVGAGALPLVAYGVLGRTVWNRPLLDRVGEVTASYEQTPTLAGLASYLWQLYLPRPPFLTDFWRGDLPLWDLWLKGLIGRFGWVDYGFPEWVYAVVTALVVVVVAAALVHLVDRRQRLRARVGDLAVFATMAVGLLVAIAVISYRYRLQTGGLIFGGQFEQARYLLPLLPLGAVVVALAARAAGPRWGPVAGAALVLLALGHDLASQLQTLARFYG